MEEKKKTTHSVNLGNYKLYDSTNMIWIIVSSIVAIFSLIAGVFVYIKIKNAKKTIVRKLLYGIRA